MRNDKATLSDIRAKLGAYAHERRDRPPGWANLTTEELVAWVLKVAREDRDESAKLGETLAAIANQLHTPDASEEADKAAGGNGDGWHLEAQQIAAAITELIGAQRELLRIRSKAAAYCWGDGPYSDDAATAEALVSFAIGRAVEGDELRDAVNTPQIGNFLEAVKLEAQHQRDRWGVEHDAGKRVEDWVTLMIYLLGKLATSHWAGDRDKLLHHVVTGAAVLLNMHANLTGVDTAMRPGLAPDAGVLPPQPNEET